MVKISQITDQNIIDYCRIDYVEDNFTIGALRKTAEEFIKKYTGLENLDDYEDVSLAYMVLIADMYDTRTMTVQNDKVNPLVQQILDLHRRNFIPQTEEVVNDE